MSRQSSSISKRNLTAFDFVNLTLITLLSIIMIYPFYNIVIVSFSEYSSFIQSSAYVLPYSFQFDNYKAILTEAAFFRGIMVTVFTTAVGTALSMLFSVCCAYALSQKELPGRNFIISFIIFTMFFSGGLIPYYLIIRSLRIVDTVWVMVFPVVISSFYMFIMKSYLLTIPASLSESAKIDGANDLHILFRIIIPVSKPIMATICLFYAVDKWNEWWLGLLFISNPKIRPLQIVLREILINMSQVLSDRVRTHMELTNSSMFTIGMQAAAIVLTMTPIILFYPMLQKYFVKGIMIGSMKE